MSFKSEKEYERENKKLRKAIDNMKVLVGDLTERESLLQQIMEKLPATIYVNDANTLHNEWMNSRGFKFLGYSQAEIKKMGFDLFTNHLHAEDFDVIEKSLAFYKHNNGEFTSVYRMKDKNKQWRWIYGNTCVLKRNPDGSPWLILGIGIDITEPIQTEPQLKSLLQEKYHAKNSYLSKGLTKREKELVKLIAKGFTNKKIAEKLGISLLTAETHRKNILKKLDVKNTAGITSFVYENFLD